MTRGFVGLSRRGPPHPGHAWSLCVSEVVTCSGGKGSRRCLSWPGWPPRERLWPSDLSDGFGLTISEEGGFEDVAEFFLAAASCSRTRPSSTSSAVTLA